MVYNIEGNVILNTDDLFVLNSKTLNKLRTLADESPLKRSRILLHQNRDELTQEMIILLKNGTEFKPHRHPKEKSESYHMIHGSMKVNIFNDSGEIVRVIYLDSRNNIYFRNSNSAWHQPVPTSDYVCYHETYTGPFVKEKDVEECKW